MEIDGNLYYNPHTDTLVVKNIFSYGADFVLNDQFRRQKADGTEPNSNTNNRRALVHGPGDQLIINYDGDYTGNGGSSSITPVLIDSACEIDGVCTATSFSGNLSGNASSATLVKINTENTVNATRYIAFAAGGNGLNHQMQVDGALYYNPSSNILTAGTFNGNLSGNASSATTAAGLSGSPTVSLTKINSPAASSTGGDTDGLIIRSPTGSNSHFYLTRSSLNQVESTYIRAGSVNNDKSRVLINDNGKGETIIGQEKDSRYTRIRTHCTISYTCSIDGTCSAASFNATSDIRLKENIEKLDSDLMLNKITSLNGVSFEFKKNLGKRYLGVIAQDVEKQFPDLVSEGNGNKKMKKMKKMKI